MYTMGEDLTKHMVEIDERWMEEWVEWGIQSFEKSLRNHAKFEEYLKEQEAND